MKTLKLLLLFVLLASHCFSQSKEELFEAGKRDLEEGWPITAVDYFSDAIALDSTFAWAYYYRGLAYLKGARSDRYTPAVNDFYKCIKLQPDSNFWQAYFYIADKKLFPDTSALNYYSRAIELNPTNHLLYQKRGFLKQWNRMFSEALADYDKAIHLNKDDFLTYDFKASIEIQMGNYIAALKDINKAIELNPDYSKLYFDKTEVLCRLNQVKAAKKNHKTARLKFEKPGESLHCSCCETVRKQE
jgi:tetratricopeptide (TPR) repeat protein